MECPAHACTHCQHSAGLQGWYRTAQGRVKTVLLWVLPSTFGCFFFSFALTRLTLEKGPVTVRKDPLTTGKVLFDSGKDYNFGFSLEGT